MNKYEDQTAPEDVLDFHGRGVLRGQDVKRMTTAFIADAAGRHLTRVRIVTGRGIHSRGRAVVRPQVERTLRALEHEGRVASYHPEKVGHGGDGAFFVRIATP